MKSEQLYFELEQVIEELEILTRQKLMVNNNDAIGLILLTIFQRVFNGYHASKLLKTKGFYLEATTIIRSVVEATFVFNDLLVKPEETYDMLEKLSNHNKKTLQKKAMNHDELKLTSETFDFSNLESSRIGVSNFADLNPDNKSLYEIAYKMMCDEVHVNLFSLEKLIHAEDNIITGVKTNHDKENFEPTFFTLCYCVFIVLNGISEKFNLQINVQLEKLDSLLTTLN